MKNISSSPLVCLNWVPICLGISTFYNMVPMSELTQVGSERRKV